MQHVRHGTVATYTKLLAARRLGRGAEGKTGGRAAAGANDRNIPPSDIRLVDRSKSGIRAEHSSGEDCQAGEICQQLQRGLRNELQGR